MLHHAPSPPFLFGGVAVLQVASPKVDLEKLRPCGWSVRGYTFNKTSNNWWLYYSYISSQFYNRIRIWPLQQRRYNDKKYTPTNSPQEYKNFFQPETQEYLKSVVFLTWSIEVWPLSLEIIEISHKIQLKSTYRDQWNTKPIRIHLQRNLCRCLAVLNAESLRELEYRLFRTKFALYLSIHLHESKASVTVTSNKKLDAYLRSPGLSVGNKLCFCACIRLSSF